MQHLTRIFLASVLCALALCRVGVAKPVLHVGHDQYPAGHSSAEGAACDLARAFITADPVLFRATCVPSAMYGTGSNAKTYEAFLTEMVAQMRAQAKKKTPSPGGPAKILKVFSVRHLSQSGPASYGYATFELNDVAFVDVVVQLHDGTQSLNRTLVLEAPSGKWYVHPLPSVSPLLSAGLNDESQSTATIADTYDLVAAH